MKSNVIYRGSVKREPMTTHAIIKTALAAGAMVQLAEDGKFETAADGKGRRFLLVNRRYQGQTIEQAYTVGDTADAFRLEPEQEYYAQLADGSYKAGDELAVKADGKLGKAETGDVVLFYFDGAKQTVSGGNGYGDVVVANAYVK